MKKPILGLLVLASFLLTGCPVSNLHPLYNNSDNVAEPLLVGNWVPPDNDEKGSISFEKASANGYTMVIDDPDIGYVDRYDVQLVRLGGILFGDFRFSSRSHAGTNIDMPLGMVSAHLVVKLKVSKDDMEWSTMEDNALKNAMKTDAPPEKPTVGKLEYDANDSLVLADTETLRRYVVAHATDGFSGVEHLKRAK
jgi:hypothetical protein